MNKKVMGKKFSRDTTSRRAMYRALIRSFVQHRVLITTYAKARVIVPILEKLMVKAKNNGLSDRRFINSFCGNDREVVEKIFGLSKKITSINGSVLKYLNLPSRKGDNAPMTRIELMQKIEVSEVKKEETNSRELKPDNKRKSQKAQKETKGSESKASVTSVIKRLSGRGKRSEK